MLTTDLAGLPLANRPSSIAGLGVSERGAEPKGRSMDLLPLRCYGLIFATGRTFPLPCHRTLGSPGGGIGNPALQCRTRRFRSRAPIRADWESWGVASAGSSPSSRAFGSVIPPLEARDDRLGGRRRLGRRHRRVLPQGSLRSWPQYSVNGPWIVSGLHEGLLYLADAFRGSASPRFPQAELFRGGLIQQTCHREPLGLLVALDGRLGARSENSIVRTWVIALLLEPLLRLPDERLAWRRHLVRRRGGS